MSSRWPPYTPPRAILNALDARAGDGRADAWTGPVMLIVAVAGCASAVLILPSAAAGAFCGVAGFALGAFLDWWGRP